MKDSRKVLALDVGKLTDIGRVRQHKLDCLGFYKPTDPEQLYTKGELFLVADGMRAQDLGVTASRLATEVIIKQYYAPTETTDFETAIKHAFNVANMQILELNQKKAGDVNTGVSVACALIQRGTLHIAHVGMCRIYLMKGTQIRQVTHDHSNVTQSTAPPEWRKIGPKTEISRALGWEPNIEIDYETINLRPNDCILLCTDGLYQTMDNREIARLALIYTPHEACERLIALANEKGGPDNITTILIKIAGLVTLPESLQIGASDGINLMQAEATPVQSSSRFGRATIRLHESPGMVTPRPAAEPVAAPPTVERKSPPPVQPPVAAPPPAFEPVVEPNPKPKPADFTFAPEPEPEREPADFTLAPEPSTPPLFTDFSQSPHGIQRKRKTFETKPKFRFQRYLPAILLLLASLLLFTIVFILLLKEKDHFELPTLRPETQENLPADSTQPAPIKKTPAPVTTTTKPESIATKPKVTPPSSQAAIGANLKLTITNGRKLSETALKNLMIAINAAKLSNVEIKTFTTQVPNLQHSKILYRFPTHGDATQVREVAKNLQNILSQQYQKVIEITACDLTIIIGLDFRLNQLQLKNLKRKVLDTGYTNAVNVEILNGQGKAGLAKTMQTKLENLFIDNNHFLRIADSRNALHFRYAKTVIRCRPTDRVIAEKILQIIGFPQPASHLELENVEDLQLILAEDL
ncbi:protein phosphatase 2C domain-containing protein [candidate division KSB1 bacterium]|nr:protein phosphatase 2C domain-containing protein [candidate division KSB1 bacterium]